MLRGEIPEFMPAYVEPHMMPIQEELLTPQAVPDGPFVTSLGVTYVGGPENNYGAMPEPGKIVISDITKWRDQLKIRDIAGRDWEGYYKKQLESIDREKLCVGCGGGDYFLTLVSLMSFEGALLAMYEEPEEVIALFEHISEFYLTVLKQQLLYVKPDIYILMDDDSAYRAPFFSLEMHRKLIRPFQKRHCDLILDAGGVINRHDCGKSEQYIDDWLELGITAWNPVQITNDCVGIKKKYQGRLALEGCWDMQGWTARPGDCEKALKDALAEYVDTFAPNGGFTYAAAIGGPMDDPEANVKRDIIKDFYYDYARDWYKTH